MQAVCRWIAGRYSKDKAKRGISKEQIASDTRLSDTGVLGVKDRGVSLCFVAFRFVWQVGSGYGGGRRKLSAAIGAKLALGGCVGMRMDVWERCDE